MKINTEVMRIDGRLYFSIAVISVDIKQSKDKRRHKCNVGAQHKVAEVIVW